MGSPAVSYSDIPQGATVVQGYSDLPKGATVVQAQPSAWDRFTAGLKSAIPSWQAGGISNAIDQQLQQQVLSPQQNPLTWEHLKSAFNASPVGMAVHGNVAGALGAATPSAVMGAAMMAPESISEAGATAVRGVAKAAQMAVDKGVPGAVIGAAIGHATGIPEAGVAGAFLGRAMSPKGTVPGQQFGLPEPEPTPIDWSVFERAAVQPKSAPISQPEPPASASAPEPMNQAEFAAQQAAKRAAVKANPAYSAPQSAPQATSGPYGPMRYSPSQDAVDLAKALGAGTPARAEARFGRETWERMVRGKDTVADAVDAAVPAGNVNDAATNVAGAALATGNVQHAQDVIQAAAQVPVGKGPESMPPTDFQLQPRNPSGTLAQQPTRALQWEDFLDDKAWKNRMEADYGTDLGPAPEKNWGPSQYIGRAYEEAVPTSREGRAVQTEEVKAGLARSGAYAAKSVVGEQARQELGMPQPEAKFAVGDQVKFAGGSGTVTRISPEFGTVQVDTGGNLPRLFGAGELKLSSGRGAQRRAGP